MIAKSALVLVMLFTALGSTSTNLESCAMKAAEASRTMCRHDSKTCAQSSCCPKGSCKCEISSSSSNDYVLTALNAADPQIKIKVDFGRPITLRANPKTFFFKPIPVDTSPPDKLFSLYSSLRI